MVRFGFKLLLFFALSMLFITSLGEKTERSADHSIVALTWPHSIDPSSTLAYFTLHGVWPGDSEDLDNRLEYCDPNNTLPKSAIKPLFTDLMFYWPNLKSSARNLDGNYKFWNYEWVKHGTCSGLTAGAYFSNAIDLCKKFYKIVKVLKDEKQITPGKSKKYPIKDFLTTFESSFGAKAVIVCDGLKLKEFRINVTNDPTPKIQNMNPPFTVNCGANAIIEFL